MATIQYLITVVDQASRRLTDIADAAAKAAAATDATQEQVDRLNKQLTLQAATSRAATAGLNAVTKATLATAAAQRAAASTTRDSGNAALFATRGWLGLWGIIGRKVTLFGGLFGTTGLLASVGAVHLLADAVLEVAAVLIPAAVAFGVFGAAAVPTVSAINDKMHAVYITSTALGRNIYPMTGQFSRLADAVRPQVYQLFGEALVVINHNIAGLASFAKTTGRALDTLGARAAAALTSGGLAVFLANGPADLARIGDIIGNIFGTAGNLLKTMPGFAMIMLNALDGLTRGLESVTASPVAQWFIRAGLWAHGFAIWVGLAATAAVFLGNALIGLAAKFGLARAGAVALDLPLLTDGILTMVAGVGSLGAALVTMAGRETVAAASTDILSGAMLALDAVNPVVWVLGAAAAIGFLVWQFNRGDQAAKQFVANVQAGLGSVATGYLGGQIARQQSDALTAIATAQKQLNALTATGQVGANSPFVSLEAQAVKLGQTLDNNKALLPVLAQDNKNWSAAMKAAGGNLGLLNTAGVTSNDILNATKSTLPQYIIQIQAAADAQKALALGTGRAAASQNAQTNAWMTGALPAMQQLITAEDAVTTMILGGRQAFLSFDQSVIGTSARFSNPNGLIAAAKVAGASFHGLNQQSLALQNTFYNIVVPASQKMIDSLESQGISTGNLTTAIATMVKQQLPWIRNNTEAKSVLVDLVNNALGPGTVSMKSLHGWTGRNATSMRGFNSIVAQSTVNAGNLAGTLKGLLNAQFSALLLTLSGVSGPHGALAKFTTDLLNGTAATSAGKADRANLILDLEKTGMNAKAARDYVDGLQRKIDALHGKNVGVGVHASGSGGVSFTETAGLGGHGALFFHAAGGLVRGGVPGKDSVLGALMPGEVVVPTAMVAAGLVDHLRGRLPGFADGGLVGPQTQNFMASAESQFAFTTTASFMRMAVSAMRNAVQAVQAAAGAGNAANAALARSMYPPWASGPEWTAWNNVAMRESGWSATAVNPSSGAAGIAQNIAGWSRGYQYGNAAQQIGWMISYILGRYGDPVGAWRHEMNFGWYDHGGWLAPGLTMAYNATGKPERVSPPGSANDATLNDLAGLLEEANDLLDAIASYTRQGPQQTGIGMARVLSRAAHAEGYKNMYSTRG